LRLHSALLHTGSAGILPALSLTSQPAVTLSSNTLRPARV
jgi:hypothetical protein